jgi:hypothetical protein
LFVAWLPGHAGKAFRSGTLVPANFSAQDLQGRFHWLLREKISIVVLNFSGLPVGK